MRKINILILANSKNSFEEKNNFYPICLTETGNISLLENIILNTKDINYSNYFFTFSEDDAKKYHLNKIVSILVKNSNSILVPENTQGSACTSLLAACQMEQDSELLIICANELVKINFKLVIEKFQKNKYDAGTIVFKSIHPRYSYVKLDELNYVKEASQKEPISDNATAGVFWFFKTSDFVNGAKNIIRKGATVDNLYYIALVFNELVLSHQKIGVYELPQDKYFPLKEEKQINNFESKLKYNEEL